MEFCPRVSSRVLGNVVVTLMLLGALAPKSLPAQQQSASLIITNNTRSRVQVLWKNKNNGPDLAWGFVDSGETMTIATVLTHEWLVRDSANGQVIRTISVARPQEQIVLAPADVPADPAAIDPDGKWEYASRTYQFTLRKVQEGLEWTGSDGTVFRFLKSGEPDLYRLAGNAQVTLRFSSPNDGVLANNGLIRVLRVREPSRPATFKTPGLRGLSAQAAEQQLRIAGLKASPASGDVAPESSQNGLVYSQSPAAGVEVAAGAQITFRFYKPARLRMPALTGLSQQAAADQLRQLGFVATEIAGDTAPDASQNGLIYRQRPAAGEAVSANSEIILFYYKDAPSRQPIPGLVNELKFYAEDALRNAGFSAESQPGQATSDPTLIGRIYSQIPAEGTGASQGAAVRLTYYTKQMPPGDQVQVPWIINMTRWDAEMRLLNHGLIPDARELGPAPEPAKFGFISPWGQGAEFQSSGQNPRGDTFLNAGSRVSFQYFSAPPNPGPHDAHWPNPIPDMIPCVNSDGSLDIAWTRKDGKTFYSRFSGRNWQQADHFAVPTALRYLAGMTKDDAGNSYIATMRQEYVRRADWDNYRADVPVAHLLRVRSGARSAELVVNLNQSSHTKWAITNPLNTDSAAFTDGRMTFGRGLLLLSYGMNNAGNHSSTNMQGFTTDGRALYRDGGGPHPYETRVHFDGQDFVMMQIFEAGTTLRKVTGDANGLQASHAVLVFHNDGANQNPQQQRYMRLGGIVDTPGGYLIVVSYATAGNRDLGNYYPSEIVPASGARLYAIEVPRNFEVSPEFRWDKSGSPWRIAAELPRFQNRVFSNPAGGTSHIRPRLVDLRNGTCLVLCEQHRSGGGYDTTNAFLIDAGGNVVNGPKALPGARLHANNDGFLLPDGRAGWVSGDAAGNRINLYLLDSQLNLSTTPLPLPE